MKPIEMLQRKKDLKTQLLPLSVEKYQLIAKLEKVKLNFSLLHEEYKELDKKLYILLRKHKVVTAKRLAKTVKETSPIPPTYAEIMLQARNMKVEEREELLKSLQGI